MTLLAALCSAALVHYTPYPGGAPGLTQLPWVRGTSNGVGLIGLIWYWPPEWRDQQRARIYAGGQAPSGTSTKILWTFVKPKARRSYRGGGLTVTGERLDAPGATSQSFVPISFAGQKGAPSFASIVDLPSVGCWRLHLDAGGLTATVVFEAVGG